MIGIPHEIKGESAIAFAILKSQVELDEATIRAQLVQTVRNNLAKFAAPERRVCTCSHTYSDGFL